MCIMCKWKQKLAEGKGILNFMTIPPAPWTVPDKEGKLIKYLFDESMQILPLCHYNLVR